jgi:hypothetical protein
MLHLIFSQLHQILTSYQVLVATVHLQAVDPSLVLAKVLLALALRDPVAVPREEQGKRVPVSSPSLTQLALY